MARKEVSGVRGVLGGLISASPAEQPAAKDSPSGRPKSNSNMHTPQEQPEPPKPRARLGRPPGRQSGESPPKEKVTVRIDARLAAVYRDWSWDQRCQLGELFERALRAYRSKKT